MAAAFLERRSSAHDFGVALGGGEAFGVSSVVPLVSGADVAGVTLAVLASTLSVATDFWVADATLGAFADRIGIRGTAGLVWLRACEGAAVGGACARAAGDWVKLSAGSSSEGG